MDGAITIREIPVEEIDDFWDSHIRYLVDDGIISDPDECFRYMQTLPERERQISMFEVET